MLFGLLAGCATTPLPGTQQNKSASRVPPESRAGAHSRYQAPEITAYRGPVTPGYAKPQPGRAVQALMKRAEAQRRDGQLVAAASSLERAIRIEPKNAVLWNHLAHVRFDQKQYELAASLAAKSKAFTGQDQELRDDNDYLINSVRTGN